MSSDQADWIWKSWDDSNEVILFHTRSRQTHVLDCLSASVLKQWNRGVRTTEQLAEGLIREFEFESTAREDSICYVANLLPRLVELGLVSEFRT